MEPGAVRLFWTPDHRVFFEFLRAIGVWRLGIIPLVHFPVSSRKTDSSIDAATYRVHKFAYSFSASIDR